MGKAGTLNVGCLDSLKVGTILAIDPGTAESAYCLWDGKQILRGGKVPNAEINYVIGMLCLPAESLAIEMIGHYGTGMPAGSEVFETCVWIGRFYEWWLANHPKRLPALVKRGKVKVHLCGSARAKDGNVRQALIDRIGPQGTKANPGPTYGVSGDVWQALALAVYAYDEAKGGDPFYWDGGE